MAKEMRDERRFNIIDYIKAIWSRRYLVLFIAILVTFGAVAATLMMTTKYRATTAIMVPQATGPTPGFVSTGVDVLMSMVGFGEISALDTETYVMTSLRNLESVADELNLYVDRRKIPKDEYGENVVGPISINKLNSAGEYTIRFVNNSGDYNVYYNDDEYVGSGKIGERYTGGGLKFVVTGDFKKGDEIEFSVWDKFALLEYLGNVAITTKNPGPRIIEITADWTDRITAKNILKLVLEKYLKLTSEYEFSSMEESLAILGEEIEEAEEEPLELEVSEEEIELKEEEGLELGEVEEEETLTDQVQPEVLKEPLEPVPSVEKVIEEPEKVAPRVKEIEIVSIGDPQKISSSSLKLPLTLKLTEFDKEAKINIIIQLEELISE